MWSWWVVKLCVRIHQQLYKGWPGTTQRPSSSSDPTNHSSSLASCHSLLSADWTKYQLHFLTLVLAIYGYTIQLQGEKSRVVVFISMHYSAFILYWILLTHLAEIARRVTRNVPLQQLPVTLQPKPWIELNDSILNLQASPHLARTRKKTITQI